MNPLRYQKPFAIEGDEIHVIHDEDEPESDLHWVEQGEDQSVFSSEDWKLSIRPSPSSVYNHDNTARSLSVTVVKASNGDDKTSELKGTTESKAETTSSQNGSTGEPSPTNNADSGDKKLEEIAALDLPKMDKDMLQGVLARKRAREQKKYEATSKTEEPVCKKPKLRADELPEYFRNHIRFAYRDQVNVDPKVWQAFLRTQLETLKYEESGMESKKSVYHGKERMRGLSKLDSSHVIVKDEPPIQEYPDDVVSEVKELEAKESKWEEMQWEDEESDLYAYNPYTRALWEAYRVDCPDCGFLMIPHDDRNWPYIPGWTSMCHNDIEGLTCTACYSDKFVHYPLPACPFRKPKKHNPSRFNRYLQ